MIWNPEKAIDSSDASNIESIGTGEKLEKPMFDFPPTRHPMLNFFNYYPNENTNEEWHPILEYLTETTLKEGFKQFWNDYFLYIIFITMMAQRLATFIMSHIVQLANLSPCMLNGVFSNNILILI